MARKADTVLFIPGFLCDHRVWAHQVESVSNDYNTLVIDIRNCKNLDEMLSQIKSPTSESFHLVGFSMGGYVAQVFAAKNPQKIKSLTMVCSNVGKLS
jgi:pimeloyl-ACP methyl ester carboxylesterase